MHSQREVISEDEVVENIRRYNEEITSQPRLAARIKQHPAWYAVQFDGGVWIFGPSKFVGYHAANAQRYLASYSRKDGGAEPALKQWFEQVDLKSDLGRKLSTAFIAFAERFGKTAHVNWRVSVPQKYLASAGVIGGSQIPIATRIAFDQNVCGGRARIAGTRIRVSDIVAMVAEGAERREILEDYPYLSDADITAALVYAARAVDHLILRAA